MHYFQVRWNSIMDKSVPEPPTAVLVHGILGCRKNWGMYTVFVAKIGDASKCNGAFTENFRYSFPIRNALICVSVLLTLILFPGYLNSKYILCKC